MRFKTWTPGIAVALLALAAPAWPIGLNEIMFDPDGNENTDEFIELYNEQPYHVNLTGWLISDGAGVDSLVALDQGLIVPAHRYVLILDPEYLSEESLTYDGMVPEDAIVVTISNSTFGSRGLSNSTAETISLLNPQGTTVSSYTYSIGNVSGRSDERILFASGNDSTNWTDATVPHGTPGRRNSVTPPERDLSIARIHALPPIPSADDRFAVSIVVRNSGLTTLSDSLRLFERRHTAHGDLLTLVRFWPVMTLSTGDSATFEVADLIATVAPRYFRAQLAGTDDRPENNVADVTVSPSGLAGAVVINEIMYAPEIGMSEWVELKNASVAALRLGGWRFGDGTGLVDTSRCLALPDITLAADSFIILAADSAIFFERLPSNAQVLVWNAASITLNNTGDSLMLWDHSRALMDRVDYRPSWGGGSGISLERVSVSAASGNPLNWAGSLDSTGGTPGRSNSRSLPVTSLNEQILVLEPNPFSPDNDGHDDLLAIRYRLEQADSRIDLKIYDVAGREVRRLASNSPAGYTGVVLWDGTDGRGRILPTGLYIVYLEALGKGGSRIQSARRVVALARPA